MDGKKIIAIACIFVMTPLLVVVGFFAYQKYHKADMSQQETGQQETKQQEAAQTEKNYFEINDELAGVNFKIPKNFERIPTDQLRVKNPNFIYGFSVNDNKALNCFVSQTAREKPGAIKISYLRDGILEQMRKTFPDAKLDSAEMLDLGNKNMGVKFFFDYVDNEAPMLQMEVVGVTDKTATFAFCIVPAQAKDSYWDNLNLFLDSLQIK